MSIFWVREILIWSVKSQGILLSIICGNPEVRFKMVRYGQCSKIVNTFLFLFLNKMLVFRAGIYFSLLEQQRRNTLIRLLLQKTDLGLHCLSKFFLRQLVFEIMDLP